jgi:hypothetical protein
VPSSVQSEARQLNFFLYNFRSCRCGSSLTVCARLTVRSFPHQKKRTFFGAYVCRVTLNTSPKPSEVISDVLEPLDTFSKYQKSHSAGGRWGPQIFWGVGILIFLLLRSPCKIAKPNDNPFWEN